MKINEKLTMTGLTSYSGWFDCIEYTDQSQIYHDDSPEYLDRTSFMSLSDQNLKQSHNQMKFCLMRKNQHSTKTFKKRYIFQTIVFKHYCSFMTASNI